MNRKMGLFQLNHLIYLNVSLRRDGQTDNDSQHKQGYIIHTFPQCLQWCLDLGDGSDWKASWQFVQTSTSSSCCHRTSVSEARIFSNWTWKRWSLQLKEAIALKRKSEMFGWWWSEHFGIAIWLNLGKGRLQLKGAIALRRKSEMSGWWWSEHFGIAMWLNLEKA